MGYSRFQRVWLPTLPPRGTQVGVLEGLSRRVNRLGVKSEVALTPSHSEPDLTVSHHPALSLMVSLLRIQPFGLLGISSFGAYKPFPFGGFHTSVVFKLGFVCKLLRMFVLYKQIAIQRLMGGGELAN